MNAALLDLNFTSCNTKFNVTFHKQHFDLNKSISQSKWGWKKRLCGDWRMCCHLTEHRILQVPLPLAISTQRHEKDSNVRPLLGCHSSWCCIQKRTHFWNKGGGKWNVIWIRSALKLAVANLEKCWLKKDEDAKPVRSWRCCELHTWSCLQVPLLYCWDCEWFLC